MIIGIYGEKGSGKDTVGKIMWCNLLRTYDWEIKQFGDKLKEAIMVITRYTRDQVEDRNLKDMPIMGWESTVTLRDFMNALGTDICRMLYPDIWVKSLMCQYSKPFSNWIITDIRMPNEAAAVKSVGGILIKIIRLGLDNNLSHITENALIDYAHFDYVIVNDGTKYELTLKVKQLLIDMKMEHEIEHTALRIYENAPGDGHIITVEEWYNALGEGIYTYYDTRAYWMFDNKVSVASAFSTPQKESTHVLIYEKR